MSPVRHILVKKRNKAFAVIRDNEVCEFMQDNVVQALDIFLGEFEIKPNGAALRAASAPLGFHALDEEALNLDVPARPAICQSALRQQPEVLFGTIYQEWPSAFPCRHLQEHQVRYGGA